MDNCNFLAHNRLCGSGGNLSLLHLIVAGRAHKSRLTNLLMTSKLHLQKGMIIISKPGWGATLSISFTKLLTTCPATKHDSTQPPKHSYSCSQKVLIFLSISVKSELKGLITRMKPQDSFFKHHIL